MKNKWLEQIEQGLMLRAQREMGFKQLTDAVPMHMETTDEFSVETNIEEDTMWVTLDHREMPLLRIQLQVNNSNEISLTCNVCQEEMDPLTMNFILERLRWERSPLIRCLISTNVDGYNIDIQY